MDIKRNFFWQVLVLFVIIRFFLVGLAMVGVQGGLEFENGFPVNMTGDEPGYFHVAENFAEFEPKGRTGFGTIGAGLVYVPYIWLADDPETPVDIYKPVFIVQAFVLYPISIILVAWIAYFVFRKYLLAAVTAGIYLVYPYGLYFINAGPLARNTDFQDAVWFRPVMSDAPSAFFVYLGVFLFAYAFFARKKPVRNTILAGLVMGFAALVRFTNILVCAAIGLTQLAQKRYKEFALFFAFSLLVFSGQLLYNYQFHGKVFWISKLDPKWHEQNLERHTSSPEAMETIAHAGPSPRNYWYLLSLLDEYIPFLPVILVAGAAGFVLGMYQLFRIHKEAALFVLFWIVLFSAFYASASSAARNIRYWLPVVPAYIILAVAFGIYLYDVIGKVIFNGLKATRRKNTPLNVK